MANKIKNECYIVVRRDFGRYTHVQTKYGTDGLPILKLPDTIYVTDNWENCKGFLAGVNLKKR